MVRNSVFVTRRVRLVGGSSAPPPSHAVTKSRKPHSQFRFTMRVHSALEELYVSVALQP